MVYKFLSLANILLNMNDEQHIIEEKSAHKHINSADSATDTAQNLIDILHRLHAFLAPSLLVLFAVMPPLRILITFALLSAESILLYKLKKEKDSIDEEPYRDRHTRLVSKIILGFIVLVSLCLSVALPHIALTMYITSVVIEFVKDLINLNFHKQQYVGESLDKESSLSRIDALSLQIGLKFCDCTANTVALIGALLISPFVAKMVGVSVAAASSLGMNLLLGAGVATVSILLISEVSRFVTRAYHQAKLIKKLNQVETQLSELVIPEKCESIKEKHEAIKISKQKLELSYKQRNLLFTEHDNNSKLIYGGIKTVGNIAVLIGVVLSIVMLNPLPGLLVAGGAFFAGATGGFISNRLRTFSREQLEVDLVSNVIEKAQADYEKSVDEYKSAIKTPRGQFKQVAEQYELAAPKSLLSSPPKAAKQQQSRVTCFSKMLHRSANDSHIDNTVRIRP